MQIVGPPLIPDTLTTSHSFVTGPACAQPAPATIPHQAALPECDKTTVWGLDFARLDMQQVIARADQIIQSRLCRYFITANLNYVMLTHQLPELLAVNSHADAIIADGFPIVLRSRLTSQPVPCRVAGSDMIIELARLAQQRGYRLFLLGAAPGVAQRAADKLCEMFPQLQIAGCLSPSFKAWSDQEKTQIFSQIISSRADILLVAFGQPKGERWIYQHHQELGIPLSIQLGASFDFLAGTAQRAPAMWQSLGCEWLYRTLAEPRRLGPRYWNNIRFLCRCLISDALKFLRKSRVG